MRKQVYKAIERDKPKRLQLLLNSGAGIEAIEGYEVTPLSDAAACNSINCLKLLLKNGANIEAKDDCLKYTPLFWAAVKGCAECLKLLLESGADVEAKEHNGVTALTIAVWRGHANCLKILLEAGAKVSPGLRERHPEYKDLWAISTL